MGMQWLGESNGCNGPWSDRRLRANGDRLTPPPPFFRRQRADSGSPTSFTGRWWFSSRTTCPTTLSTACRRTTVASWASPATPVRPVPYCVCRARVCVCVAGTGVPVCVVCAMCCMSCVSPSLSPPLPLCCLHATPHRLAKHLHLQCAGAGDTGPCVQPAGLCAGGGR